MTEQVGPVPEEVARHVRVLAALGIASTVTAEVTGCPETLIDAVVRADGHEEEVRRDLALLAVADRARMSQAGEPDEPEYEEVARWLAEQSDHPRYVADKPGWRALLTSEVDVEVAYQAAMKRLGGVTGLRSTQAAESLRGARDMLTRHAKAAQREQDAAGGPS